MKTIKRIIAVVFLMFLVLLIGYSCYTGSRLTGYPQTLDGYKNVAFYGNDGYRVAFTDGYAWYERDGDILLLEIQSYTDGVMRLTDGTQNYVFTAVDKDTLYDTQTERFLTKGVDG